MDQEKSGEYKRKCSLSGKLHGLRNNLNQRHRQHVARAQRQKVLQKSSRPLTPHYKVSAQQVSARGHQPEDRRPNHPHRFLVRHFTRSAASRLPPSFLGAMCVATREYSVLAVLCARYLKPELSSSAACARGAKRASHADVVCGFFFPVFSRLLFFPALLRALSVF